MKRLGRVIGIVLAGMLAVLSLQALAETPLAGRDFNHDATGFPLTGVHTLTACETCHAGGVFKGTPRNCDACHSLGKRIVATPKSTSHIVTDAPCDTCHFNASTFLGARFNHATAVPGTCATCHNGRQSVGKPASHSSGNKATKSCDSCHRSYTWFNASWNHVGVVPGTCGTACHYAGGDGTAAPASHTGAPVQYTIVTKASFGGACDACHSYGSWLPGMFKHLTALPCTNCHTMKVGHIATNGATCDTCHRSRAAWLPASWHSGNETGICGTCHNGTIAKGTSSIALHIPVTNSGNACDNCHKSTTSFATWTMNHAANGNTTACNPCHASTAPNYPPGLTRKTIGSHEGSKAGQDCYSCHNKGINWRQ